MNVTATDKQVTSGLTKVKAKRKEVFPGLGMLVAGGIMDFWGCGIYIYSSGIYLKALSSAFGWTTAQISLAFSFARLEGGIEGPLAGIGIDKWGPRTMNLIGVSLLGLGFIMMYFINSLWMFLLFWIISATGFNAGFVHALDTAMANWYVKRRGLMIAVMRSFVAFTGLIILPLVAWLIKAYGIQSAFLVLGVVTLISGIPLTLIFIKPRRPEYYGWLPDGKRVDGDTGNDTEKAIQQGVEYAAAHEEVEFTLRQAMREKSYWFFMIVACVGSFTFPAINTHTYNFLTSIGIDNMKAAFAFGTLVFMTLPGRLIFGWFSDRVSLRNLRFLKALCFGIQALGLAFLIYARNMNWVWTFLVLFGAGQGGNIALTPPMRGRFWGRKAFASIQGSMQAISTPFGLVGPVFAGWVFDTTGTYTGAFKLILLFTMITALCSLFLIPPVHPETITDINKVV